MNYSCDQKIIKLSYCTSLKIAERNNVSLNFWLNLSMYYNDDLNKNTNNKIGHTLINFINDRLC